MNQRTTNFILIGMLAGVIIGALLGVVWPQAMLATSVIGQLFINALKLIILPLIIASLIVGVASLGDIRKAGRTGAKVIGYFLITTTIAVIIGLILVNITRPGSGVSTVAAHLSEGMRGAQARSVSDILLNLIPANLVRAMVDGQYLGIIVFALFVGGVLTTLGPRARTMLNFFRELNQVVMKLVYLILYVAPIGLLSVVGTIVARNSGSLADLGSSLFWYGLTLILGLLIHALIVLPLILKFFGHRSPLAYAGKMLPAFATAVGTSSSSATLPVTYECVVDGNKVDSRAASFVLPLGTTVNMDGTAMYVVIATVFIGQAYGVSMGFLDMVMIGLTAVLVSIGAAGIPSAALFMLAIVFGVAGFPPEAYAGIGLILAVDWLLDRCRTSVNIWGDSIGAAVIADSEEFSRRRTGPTRRTYPPRSSRYDRRDQRSGRPNRYDRSERFSRGDQRGTRQNRENNGTSRSRDTRSAATDRKHSSHPNRSDSTTRQPRNRNASSPFAISRKETPLLDNPARSEVAEADAAETSRQPEPRNAGQSPSPSPRRRNSAADGNSRPGRSNRSPEASRSTRTTAMKSESKDSRTPSISDTGRNHHAVPPPAAATTPTRQSSEPPPAASERQEAPAVNTSPPPPPASDSRQPEVDSWGRGRARHSAPTHRETTEDSDKAAPKGKVLDHFSTESLTFGRSRRKGGR